jgi:hypothetical protein
MSAQRESQMAYDERAPDRDRCLSEIAAIEARLRSGDAHDMEGQLQGLQDWCAELREIEREDVPCMPAPQAPRSDQLELSA